jgi:hypothetical protein
MKPKSLTILAFGMSILFLSGCEKLENEHSPNTYPVIAYAPTSQTEAQEPTTTSSGYGYVSESLKNGQTTGVISDGTFTSGGLQLYGGRGFIRYSIPTTPSGYIEFSARGFTQDEIHGGSEFKAVLVTMWSGRDGYDYENAPFIFELRKYGYIEGRPDASNSIALVIKSQGIMENRTPYSVLSWNPRTPYRFHIEWGNGQFRVLRDGILVTTGNYRDEFAPADHQVQIGTHPIGRRESPHDLLISDVIIGIR